MTQTGDERRVHDALIVGAGVSGSFVARRLVRAGMRCLMLEAGPRLSKDDYPRTEAEASARLYWGGGIELDRDATIGLLRARVVGGGSVVNQALLDRFDEDALGDWRARTGLPLFDSHKMAPWYDEAESELVIQTIPESRFNRNARIFAEGFSKLGWRCAPLRRGQSDCRYDEGDDCIECLAGCHRESKQSMPLTVLKAALDGGLELRPEFEAWRVESDGSIATVHGRFRDGREASFRAETLWLAGGALGNSTLLLRSGWGRRLPALGRGFFCHPQEMVLARYDEPVDAHRGPFQGLKSDEPAFRRAGFKLENVFAPPGALALLTPGHGRSHLEWMEGVRHLACIEVAIRDTAEGSIGVGSDGRPWVRKRWNAVDRARRRAGLEAIERIFRATGARRIVRGGMAIGLHLMGGCRMGKSPRDSVVGPDFRVWGMPNVFIADSSVFPSAPGINPSLTIMAMSAAAAHAALGRYDVAREGRA